MFWMMKDPSKLKVPSAKDALPGREEPMPVPAHHYVNGRPMLPPYPDGLERAMFGMGCFWGVERIFWKIEGVFVTVYDAEGASAKACTNAAGNFYIELDDWPDAKFPLAVQVGNRFMRSLIGRERSCASCHELASPSRVENDPTVNSATGAGRTSAGAILVDRGSIPPEEQCGPNPASASVAASSGAGAAGGTGGTGGEGVGGAGGGS